MLLACSYKINSVSAVSNWYHIFLFHFMNWKKKLAASCFFFVFQYTVIYWTIWKKMRKKMKNITFIIFFGESCESCEIIGFFNLKIFFLSFVFCIFYLFLDGNCQIFFHLLVYRVLPVLKWKTFRYFFSLLLYQKKRFFPQKIWREFKFSRIFYKT